MNKLLLFLSVFYVLNSCNDSEKNFKDFSMNQSSRDINDIKTEVESGNIKSYEELRIMYLDYPSEDFLFWALLMANKYDYPQAYLDVFHAIVFSYPGDAENFNNIDKRTQKLALEYLQIAAKKGVKEASETLKNIE